MRRTKGRRRRLRAGQRGSRRQRSITKPSGAVQIRLERRASDPPGAAGRLSREGSRFAMQPGVAAPARAVLPVPDAPEGAVRAAFGHVRPLYIPVHLDGLVMDAVVDFHLHLQTSPGHFVLFRGPDLEFTSAHHARLLANNVQTLWL